MSSIVAAGSPRFGICVPGFTAGGFAIHLLRLSAFIGRTPAMSLLLAMCVRSGPTLPWEVVPWIAWQPTQAFARYVCLNFAIAGSLSRSYSATADLAHAAYSFWGCTTIVM